MDFYLLLGVEREASLADIKRAYKRLARKYHPDINPGDSLAAQQFRQIATAYETLIDPERRRRYDSAGGVVDIGSPAFGFEGFDFSVRVSGDAAPTFGDLFADVFRARTEQARPERGPDLHLAVRLSFEDSLRGGTRQVTVTRTVHCPRCLGTGHVQAVERTCGPCRGTGIVKSTRNHMVFSKPCLSCGGAGLLAHAKCPTCHGRQLDMLSESLSVTLPPGLQDGARVRLPGKGHDGPNGGEAGDVYITVHVEPDPRFRRDGDDLHLTVPIAVHEAALGAKVEIQSFDGVVRLRVPPGTQTGQRFRLSERGAPSPRDGRRGDLVIEVRMVLPPVLDERSKELLREFGRINSGDVRRELA
ncbi:MAG: DnaJ C-terminal domain-containing protein [Vicinamibacterales bacterium]